MGFVNKVMLMGNLTRDPELKQLPSGSSVCEFCIAANRTYKTPSGEEKEEAVFTDCAAFGRAGEVIAEYVKQGRPLFVEGRLHYETWEDKQGNRRSKLSVVVENFQFVGGKSDEGYGGEPKAQNPQQRGAMAAAKASTRPPARTARAPADASMRAPHTPAPSDMEDADLPF
jgi:single-strand DNA-binding protein